MELSSDSEILEKQIFFYSTSVHSILMQNWWSQKTKNKKKTKKKRKKKKRKEKETKSKYIKTKSKSYYTRWGINPLSANPTKWSNTLKQFVGNLPKNCLSVFDHFVGLALKGLKNMTLKQN